MNDSNFSAECARLRQHAMEVKLVGGFMEVSPSDIVFLLDKIESLEKELEVARKSIVEEPTPKVDNQETFTAWLRNTGQCLVPDQGNTTIEVSLRDGTVQRGRANEVDWRIIGDGGDILHYRGTFTKINVLADMDNTNKEDKK